MPRSAEILPLGDASALDPLRKARNCFVRMQDWINCSNIFKSESLLVCFSVAAVCLLLPKVGKQQTHPNRIEWMGAGRKAGSPSSKVNVREIKHERLALVRQLIPFLARWDNRVCPIEAEQKLDGAAVRF